MMNRFSLCLIFGIFIHSFSTQMIFAQGCMDEPTEADIGAYPYYEEGYAYRYASSFPSYQEFGIVQWWGCCEPAGDFNIQISTVYGNTPSLDWTSSYYGADRGYDFTSGGKYVVGSSHPGFSNCSGTYSVDSLVFFLTDDQNDLDADGTENINDSDADGDGIDNDVDNDDDNDGIVDANDSTPGGPGTTQGTWPVAWGGSMQPTPTPMPTPTPTPLPDDSWIIAYVSSGHPFNNFPGHTWAKVCKSGSGMPFNCEQVGYWPEDYELGKDASWFSALGIWVYEPIYAGPLTTIKGIDCNRSEAMGALVYIDDTNYSYNFNILFNNCVHKCKSVFSYGYDGTIPSTASWWSGYLIQTPEAWGTWLENNIQ